MLRLILVVLVLIALCCGLAPPGRCDDRLAPKSVGITVDNGKISGVYIRDGKHYGIAVGPVLSRQHRWSETGLIILEPTDKSQLAAGASLGYDCPIGPSITLTPMVGLLRDITAGYDGRKTLGFWGVSLVIRTNLNL